MMDAAPTDNTNPPQRRSRERGLASRRPLRTARTKPDRTHDGVSRAPYRSGRPSDRNRTHAQTPPPRSSGRRRVIGSKTSHGEVASAESLGRPKTGRRMSNAHNVKHQRKALFAMSRRERFSLSMKYRHPEWLSANARHPPQMERTYLLFDRLGLSMSATR